MIRVKNHHMMATVLVEKVLNAGKTLISLLIFQESRNIVYTLAECHSPDIKMSQFQTRARLILSTGWRPPPRHCPPTRME